MTIKEAAAKYGVSPQAVYKRLNQTGVKLSTIQKPDSSELTTDGEAVIDLLFNQPKPAVHNQLRDEVTRLTTELASLQTENEALRDKVRALEADKAFLQGQNSELLSRIPPALPAAGQTAQTEKRGFWARILGK